MLLTCPFPFHFQTTVCSSVTCRVFVFLISGRGVDTRRAESGGPRGNSVLYSPAAGDEDSVSVTNDPDDQVPCSPSAGGDKDTISVTNDPNDQVLYPPSAGGDKGTVSVTNAPDVQVLYPPSAGGDKNTMCATTPAPVDSAMYRQISTVRSPAVRSCYFLTWCHSLIVYLMEVLQHSHSVYTAVLFHLSCHDVCVCLFVSRGLSSPTLPNILRRLPSLTNNFFHHSPCRRHHCTFPTLQQTRIVQFLTMY